MIMIKSAIAIVSGGFLAAILGGPAWAAAPSAWAVKEAPIRFVLDLTRAPSQPSAGYFVTIPDGGSLPGPAPELTVFDEAGNPLTSGVLWHCPDTSCALVFQAPKAGQSVVIYASGAKQLKRWTPESGLTPGAILCEINGTSARKAALQLGEFGLVGAKVQYGNQGWSAGTWKNEKLFLAMQDWRPGGTAMYLLSYVNVTDPGSTWVAPVSRAGQMDIAIDGKLLSLSKKNEKRGGVGETLNLTPGLHRVELYGYNNDGGALGPMMFSWRTPKSTVAELGGARASDVRYPGTPMFESRLPRDQEVVKSGECEIRTIESRDGGPVASFTVSPENVFLFNGEDAVIQCILKAQTINNPTGTMYRWSFDNAPGAVASGAEPNWLFKGGDFHGVTLVAEADGKRASIHTVFYPHSSDKSSIEHASTRSAFRSACLTMLKAFPEKSDPVAKWDVSLWNNFFRVLELQGRNPLVEYIVTKRWDFFRKKLDADKKALVEDLFLFSMETRNPNEAIRWADEFSTDAPNHVRSVILQLKSAEIRMIYLGDLEGARKVITPFLADSTEGGEWARIRMGDLEMLARNINAATQRYGDVQNRSKGGAAAAPAVMPKLRESTPSGPMKSADFNRLRASPKASDKKGEYAEPPPNVAAWKLAAIRDVAASENVANLIDQEYYLEALQALKAWERSFPLAKITGDYILREAKLYIALKDYKRARMILSAYCDQIDTSNFLPEALKMNRTCMVFMNEPEAEVAKYDKEILKRTQFGGGE